MAIGSRGVGRVAPGSWNRCFRAQVAEVPPAVGSPRSTKELLPVDHLPIQPLELNDPVRRHFREQPQQDVANSHKRAPALDAAEQPLHRLASTSAPTVSRAARRCEGTGRWITWYAGKWLRERPKRGGSVRGGRGGEARGWLTGGGGGGMDRLRDWRVGGRAAWVRRPWQA